MTRRLFTLFGIAAPAFGFRKHKPKPKPFVLTFQEENKKAGDPYLTASSQGTVHFRSHDLEFFYQSKTDSLEIVMGEREYALEKVLKVMSLAMIRMGAVANA